MNDYNLPPPQILSVEPDWNQSRIVDTDQRLIGSDTSQLHQDAMQAADQAIRNRIHSDTDLLSHALQYAKYALEHQLEELGFTTVLVN